MYDLLQEKGAGHVRIFGGGGGVILPEEIEELEAYGICKIFSPEDGRRMGLQGMINDAWFRYVTDIGAADRLEVGFVRLGDLPLELLPILLEGLGLLLGKRGGGKRQ